MYVLGMCVSINAFHLVQQPSSLVKATLPSIQVSSGPWVPTVRRDGLPHLSMAEYEHFVSISQNTDITARGKVSVH